MRESTISLDHYPIPDPTVVGQILDGEAVIVLSEQGQVKVLNEVGARIWVLADGTRTIRDIATAIWAKYEVEPAQAEADTLDFVAELVEHGIVALATEPSQAGG